MMRAYYLLSLAVAGLAGSASQAYSATHAAVAASTHHADYASIPASTPAPSFVTPPALPPGGTYAPLGDGIHIQGQPVFAWLLDAPGSVRDIASWLTARQPALRDLWVMPGAIVLAGITDGMHWAARLSDAGGGHTRGTLSVLSMRSDAIPSPARAAVSIGADARTAVAGGGREVPAADPGWRLPGGQLHFEFRSQDGGVSVIEQIWTHTASPATLQKQLFGDLAARGWRPADMGALGGDVSSAGDADEMQGAHYWSRGRMMLSLIVVPLDLGSGITAVVRIGA